MRPDDLLAGIIAFQLRLVSAGTLAWYAQHLKSHPDSRLFDFLAERKALTAPDCALLEKLLGTILQAHGGDPSDALETFGGAAATEEAFARSIHPTETGWEPSEEDTVMAALLPHGLPRQIAPEMAGRYTRGSEYARGGIGRILLVHDEQIGRDIIMKELLPHRAVNPLDTTLTRLDAADSPGSPMRQSAAMMARFLQEAKITGQLEHPSIVPVYELGLRTDGQLYYTMKLVRGNTLSVAIESCNSLADRLTLLRSYLEVCHAMAYAHNKGVIHRDLKPSNIMVGEFGECVVLDWGLARMQMDQEAHNQAMERTASRLQLDPGTVEGIKTRPKEVLGTPLYMSPEQARGEIDSVGYHSDVYSLGVILYEILTGALPHPWTNNLDTVRRVGTVPAPPVAGAEPRTPPELAAICDKALCFDADHRYPSAKELARDVERFLSGAVVDAYTYRIRDVLKRLYRQHKVLVNAAGSALAAILLIGMLSYIQIYRAREAAIAARNTAQEQRAIAEQQRAEADAQRANAEAERARAENAEEHTAQEKYVSDIRLAGAYVRDLKFQAAEDTLLGADPRFRHLEWEYLIAQCNQDLASLRGHTRDVFAVLSRDGTRILTMSGDQTAKLWDARTDQVLFTWALPGTYISNGAFSPDGTQIAIWMHDGRVHRFDTTSGAPLNQWAAHTMRVLNAAFNSTGEQLVTAGADRTVRIWNVANGALAQEITGLPDTMSHVVFDAGDTHLLAAPRNGMPQRFDAANGTRSPIARGKGMVALLRPDIVVVVAGQELARLDPNNLSEIWRTSCGANPGAIHFSADQNALLLGLDDGIVQLRDGASGHLQQSFNLREPVTTCLLNHAANRMIALSHSGRIRIYDVDSGEMQEEFGGQRSWLTSPATLAPDDTYLLTASADGTARKWSLNGPSDTKPLAAATPDAEPASLSGDGNRLALTGPGNELRIAELAQGGIGFQATLPIVNGGQSAALSTEGSRLAVVLDGFLPVVISLPDGAILTRFHGHAGTSTHIAFGPDSTEIITASWDGTARIWDAQTGALKIELRGHEGIISGACLSPDAQWAGTCSSDHTARVWNRVSGAVLFQVAHEAQLSDCAFSPDGTRFATASRDGTIQVWDVSTQRHLYTLSGQLSDMRNLNFSIDGKRLLANAGPSTLNIWDAHRGLLLATMAPPNSSAVPWQRYDPTSGTFLSGTRDGTILRRQPFTDAHENIRTPADLQAALAARRAIRNNGTGTTLNKRDAELAHVYLPAPTVAALLDHLNALYETRPSDRLAWMPGDSAPNTHPLNLQPGDIILTVGERTPDTVFGPENAPNRAALLRTETAIRLDVLRGDTVVRYKLHGLAVLDSVRTVTLTRTEARALLQAAIDSLRTDATTTLQVSQHGADARGEAYESAGNTVSGLVIASPRESARKALLRSAGLEAGMRITAINDAPVPDMKGLIALLEAGQRNLEAATEFSLRLQIERGAFETVALRIVSAGNK